MTILEEDTHLRNLKVHAEWEGGGEAHSGISSRSCGYSVHLHGDARLSPCPPTLEGDFTFRAEALRKNIREKP